MCLHFIQQMTRGLEELVSNAIYAFMQEINAFVSSVLHLPCFIKGMKQRYTGKPVVRAVFKYLIFTQTMQEGGGWNCKGGLPYIFEFLMLKMMLRGSTG